MTAVEVPLEAIPGCFGGAIPPILATCSAEGVPSLSHEPMVHYLDVDRIALPRRSSTAAAFDLVDNRLAQLLLVDPETSEQYVLDLELLGTERAGAVLEAVTARLEAAALRAEERFEAPPGVDVFRVCSCRRYRKAEAGIAKSAPSLPHDSLRALEEFVFRLGDSKSQADAAGRTMDWFDDLLGLRDGAVLTRRGATLQVIAGRGAAPEHLPSPVEVGSGLVGMAVERRQVICIASVVCSSLWKAAADGVQGIAGAPLVVGDDVVGAIYLESHRVGAFGAGRERLLRVVAAQLAATLRALDPERRGDLAAVTASKDDPIAVTYYQADDSVFCDGEYVIKGVPGRLLWKLLREHAADGRIDFTNRELRLDESLELPPGNDNLDSRLLSLRRRLQRGDVGIRLERVGRGQLRLSLERPVILSETVTLGPMAREPAASTAGPTAR